MTQTRWDIVILGAGCAGMSLAYRLAVGGYRGSILIVDRREDFSREQRWCLWGPVEPLIMRFVSFTWDRFRVRGNERSSLHHTPEAPYLHIHSPSFFREISGALSQHPNITLRLCAEVGSLYEDKDGVCIGVNGETMSAGMVFEARNAGSPALMDAAHSSEPWLWQSFAGQVVLFDAPVFDPGEATLMDFDVPGAGGGSFMYLLPFSERSALVESTLISKTDLPADDHLHRVANYLEQRVGKPYTALAVEAGVIPMTTHRFQSRLGPRRHAIGISGGGAKPSTGYAFARIQEQTAIIADALIQGRPVSHPAPTHDERRRVWLDDVFIEAVAQDEDLFRTCLLRMFRRMPTGSVVRFLSEKSTLLDELMVMASVGERAVVSAAVNHALDRSGSAR